MLNIINDDKKGDNAQMTVSFRGAQIIQLEVDVLNELETQLNDQFRLVNKIERTTKMSFLVVDSRVIGIGLYKCGMSALPFAIGGGIQLTKTQIDIYNSMNFDGGPLITLPESIGKLKSLQILSLGDNRLTTLPESIGKLKSLRILNLGGNQLTTLPESLGNLDALEMLLLNNIKLSTLPESIEKLSSLEELDLGENKFSTLPKSISKIPSLKILNIKDNQLSTLPKWIKEKKGLRKIHI